MVPSRLEERSLLASRLAAQLLSGAPAGDVVAATRHLLAVQGQDPRGARLALRARIAGGYASAVDYALTHERTLHLIATEDEPLLHALTTPQLRANSDRNLRQEGVSEAAAHRGITAIVKALADDGPLTRIQVRAVLEQARIPTVGYATTHLLFRATLDGLIVRGPMIGRDHAFVLVADWLGERPKIDRDRALAELARRYLAGHGPAEDRDLAKWARLLLRDARAGLAAIASELEQRHDGLVDLRRTETPPLPPPRLLGPFDPLLLGWRSRSLVLGSAGQVVTVNGIIKAIALINGRAAGTWRMSAGRVELDLWQRQSRATTAALRQEQLRWRPISRRTTDADAIMRPDVHSVFTHQAALPALAEQSPGEDQLTDASASLRPAIRSNPGGPEVVRAAGFQARPLGDGASARPL
jgi:hypothetical protein